MQCFPKMSVASAAAFMLRVGHACRTQVMLPLEPKYFTAVLVNQNVCCMSSRRSSY